MVDDMLGALGREVAEGLFEPNGNMSWAQKSCEPRRFSLGFLSQAG